MPSGDDAHEQVISCSLAQVISCGISAGDGCLSRLCDPGVDK